MLIFFKYTVFSSGPFCQVYRVTDEALIAETAVWPNFFLMNVFFALKGSKLFIILALRPEMSQTCLIGPRSGLLSGHGSETMF